MMPSLAASPFGFTDPKGETVIISEEPLDNDRIEETIKSTGYTLKGVETEPYKKEGLFSMFKK